METIIKQSGSGEYPSPDSCFLGCFHFAGIRKDIPVASRT